MARMLAALAVAVLVGGGCDILACGDKFLMVGRGTRFERPGLARTPARILFYATPQSRLSGLLSQLEVEDRLRAVGYTPATVADVQELARAFGESRWDLVIVDLADVNAIHTGSRGGGVPRIMTVVFNGERATGHDGDRGQRLMKAPRRFAAMLGAIDDVLLERTARGRTATRKAG